MKKVDRLLVTDGSRWSLLGTVEGSSRANSKGIEVAVRQAASRLGEHHRLNICCPFGHHATEVQLEQLDE